MPQTTCFEIRDRGAAYFMAWNDVKGVLPAEADTFIETFKDIEMKEPGFLPATYESGKPVIKPHVFFFKVNKKKDMTKIKLDLPLKWMWGAEVVARHKHVEKNPALTKAYVCNSFNVSSVYAGVLDATEVKSTGIPTIVDDGSWRAPPRIKGLEGMPAVPVMPNICNSKDGGVEVSFSLADYMKAKGGKGKKEDLSKPLCIGVSVVCKKFCIGCKEAATPENNSEFKKCGRCWESMHVSVWFCSVECQKKNYHKHKSICLGCRDMHLDEERIISNAEAGVEGFSCCFCQVKPDVMNIHRFLKCIKCWNNGGFETLYCSRECQCRHLEDHKAVCEARQASFLLLGDGPVDVD